MSQIILDTTSRSRPNRSELKRIWQRFAQKRLSVVSLVVVALFLLVAVSAPLISPYGANEMSAEIGKPPSSGHLLGTDLLGRDVLSRIFFAARITLTVGLGCTLVSTLIGIFNGLLSGFFGGGVDIFIMRLSDVFMSFPTLLFIIVANSIVTGGNDVIKLTLIMGIMGWPRLTRLIRGEVIAMKQLDFIKSATTAGFGNRRILIAHILPNLASLIIVQATFGIAYAIIMESSLSFLGYGINPPLATWGNMLKNAESLTTLTSLPWLWLPPGITIVVAVLMINFVGEGLSYALDPKR
jgi:peptide/nickel transport system permease protein